MTNLLHLLGRKSSLLHREWNKSDLSGENVMTYPDIRKWFLASQSGRKLFYMGAMRLISSDKCADGSCAMLAVTLGNIFGAKACWEMIVPDETKRSASFLSAPTLGKAKTLLCYGPNSPEVSVLRPRLPSEVGGVSARAS